MERLANPKNDYDVAVFEALNPEDQKLIKDGAYFKDGLKINLENDRLAYSFYKNKIMSLLLYHLDILFLRISTRKWK